MRAPSLDHLQATTTGAWLHVLIRTLDAHGLDGAKLALEAGVPPHNLEHPKERIAQTTMTRFWKVAVAATHDPCLGLEAARFVTESTFGALNHVAFVSPTLEDAYRRVVRFQRLMTEAMELDLVRVKDRLRLMIRPIAPNHPPAEEIDAFCATWVHVTRALARTPPRVEPVRIHRRRAQPRNIELFRKVFRAPIRFRAPQDFIEYDADDCQRSLPDANLELAEQYDRILARQAAAVAGATTTERVRALLYEIMVDGPKESVVAGRLHMSTSTLKAALAAESTAYKNILAEVREALAQRYLREGKYSIKEIAFLLGYADPSAFSRAFKRWTGEPPTSFPD